MKKIVCGPENVRDFNQQMREAVPEFHAFAKQLHAAALIHGLAGAILDFTVINIEPIEEQPPLPHEGHFCEECVSWHRLYRASKAGHCFVTSGYPRMTKFNAKACKQFEGAGC